MHKYDKDIVAWAKEQAAMLRARRFRGLDVERIADEIEGVAKSEQRELADRIAALIANLLKWQRQPWAQEEGGRRMIVELRKGIRLAMTPSLAPMLIDRRWLAVIWSDAVAFAAADSGEADYPDECPWSIPGQVLSDEWLPAPNDNMGELPPDLP